MPNDAQTDKATADSPAAHGSDVDESKVREAIHLVWRNLPSHASTFGECARKCGRGKGGRGSGPCLACAADDLAAQVGTDLADRYVDAVMEIRKLEYGMMAKHQNADLSGAK